VGRIHWLVASAAFAAGCASLLPAPTPMRSRADRLDPKKPARCLLLLLPGVGDDDTDFANHGFIADLRKRNLSIDTISANATAGYYARRTAIDRLDADVLGPNKAGYEQVWVAGISMGGLGSVLLARRHGLELTGVILIAPFLGEEIVDEIQRVGGLAKWNGTSGINDFQRDTWLWLKAASERPGSAPPIYLLSGDQDKFYVGHRLLGATLPPERRFRTRGDHDWGPWRVLWNDFLDHSDFAARCGTR
jgi:pimeloyl-ACP methyl ester carboxylesterase